MTHFWHQPSTIHCPGPRAAHSCDVIDGRLYVFGGWNGKKALNDLHVLDVVKGEWSEIYSKCAPSERNNHTTAVVGSKLFAHGGHDGSKWLHDLHILDTSAISLMPWNSIHTTGLAQSTGGSACSSSKGADRNSCGGSGGPIPALPSNQSVTTQSLTVQVMTWMKPTVSGNFPSSRACHTLTRVGRKLFMFGGYDGSKCFNEIEILDLDTMTWIQPIVSGTPPQARNAHTMTVIGDKLFLFGGHSGNKHLTDLHVFDTSILHWSQPEILGSPPPGLRGHTANLIGHKIFLFGGYDGKGRSNDLYILDTQQMKWVHPTDSENLPAGRQRHSASLIGSKRLYIFGGFDGHKWLNDLHVLDSGRLEEDALTDAAVRNVIENMRKLVNNAEYSDITLVVEDTDIHAHKAILVTQCEHFRAMFSGSMKESREAKVQIPGWSYNAFMAMLEFLYTGRIPEVATHVTSEVLGLADHYTLDSLKHLCENMLVHSVEAENACQLLRHADSSQALELKRYCLSYILKHFDQVARTAGFDELKETPSLLMEVTKACVYNNSK